MAGLVITDLGISLKSFQELRQELREAWVSRFGETIDLSPTSVDGHHIDLECKTITSINQLLEAVVSNFDPTKAQGVWLDILGDYKAMTRASATYSVATVTFNGTAGTEIPSGTIVRYDGAPCDFTLQNTLTLDSEGTASGPCRANAIGFVEIYVGDWKMVSSSPSGVTCEVTAENAGGSGRNDETDDEYRARQKKFAGAGMATYDKMYAYMASVVGEGNFLLQVNDEDYTDHNIPPHRFEFVFKNGVGTNTELAQAVWNCKPAGIKPYGNMNGDATDIVGLKHTMYFSRPVHVKLWVSVEFTAYTEESLPDNWSEAIAQAVSDFAATEYSPGKDIIPDRLKGPIYQAVSGILNMTVKVCVKDTEPSASEYTTDNISVSPQSVAVLQRVSVDMAT